MLHDRKFDALEKVRQSSKTKLIDEESLVLLIKEKTKQVSHR